MKKIGIYIHIPFCIRKCNYCAFLSFDNLSEGIKEDYLKAVAEELSLYKAYLDSTHGPSGYEIDSIFIGGGTPSEVSEVQLSRIVSGITDSWNVSSDCEITIEVNPGSATFEKLSVYRHAGINRLSMGLQSFDARILKRLGRIHTVDDFSRTFAAGRTAGFDNINVDLMFGVPEQTMEIWSRTLDEIRLYEPEHISFYSLQLEEGTPFFRDFEDGKLSMVSDDDDRAMYHYAADFLRGDDGWNSFLCKDSGGSFSSDSSIDSAGINPGIFTIGRRSENALLGLDDSGYNHYEISNMARPGYQCRHNMKYWTMEDYLGIGLGASGFLDGVRYQNTSLMREYIPGTAVLERDGEDRSTAAGSLRSIAGRASTCHINTQADDIEEYIFTGLRLRQGIAIDPGSGAKGIGAEGADAKGASAEKRSLEHTAELPPVAPRISAISKDVRDHLDGKADTIVDLLDRELCVMASGRLKLTLNGVDISNAIMAELI